MIKSASSLRPTFPPVGAGRVPFRRPVRTVARSRLLRWLDSLGAMGAFLCALHCALLPLALVLLPAAGLGVFNSQRFEEVFSVSATLLAVGSLWHGYRSHRGYHAWALVVPGLALIWLGLLYTPLHHSVLPHALVMTLGGTLISLAHLVNLRLSAHVHHGDCCNH